MAKIFKTIERFQTSDQRIPINPSRKFLKKIIFRNIIVKVLITKKRSQLHQKEDKSP